MRYQEAIRISIVFLVGVFILSSCNSDMGGFQQNQNYEYKLFDLLDKYPALHDALHKRDPNNTQYRADQCDKQQIRLDQCVVNDLLADVIDAHYKENISSMAGEEITIDATKGGMPNQYPMQNTVQLMRHLIYRIINQDDLDAGLYNPDTKQRTTGGSAYANNFFSFLDDISDKNLNLGKDLVAIMQAASKFRIVNLTDALMKKEVEFANTDMDATVCQGQDATSIDACNHVLARHNNLVYQQTSAGKSNLEADYPMCLDGSGNLITKFENMTGCTTNLGLGNAVQGNQSLMMAFFELVKDSSFRTNLYDLIRELGKFLSNSVPNQPNVKLADVVVALVKNIESYFTTGGTVAKNDSRYSTDDPSAEVYSSAELRNTLRELQPGTTRLMLRSDRQNASSNNAPLSLIYEVNGKKLYVIDEFIKSLKSIGWDPDNAHIEQSLDDLIRYDQYGRDRTANPNAYQTSLLESLFFLTSSARNYGWTDSAKDGVSGEAVQNYGHGHGLARQGRLDPNFNPSPTRSAGSTMNDALYAMGTNEINTVLFGMKNQYQLTFNTDDMDHLFRSVYPFKINLDTKYTIPGKDDNKFYFDENYPISFFVTGAVGAPGSPTGGVARDANGDPLTISHGSPVLNGYMPFNPIGDKNDNIALSTAVGLWHVCWNGFGPYYYDPTKTNQSVSTVQLYGKTWNKVFRANGKLYALVYKAPNGNWEYIYPPNNWDFNNPPNADEEPLYPTAFYVGRIENPVTLDIAATVNITIDNNSFNGGQPYQITFPANQSFNRDAIVTFLKDQIGVPFTVIPFGKNKFRIAGSPLPTVSPKIIKIEGDSNAIELLFGGNGPSIVRPQQRAEFWNSVNYSDYYMGYYQDIDLIRPYKYSTIIRNDDTGDIDLVTLYISRPDQQEASGVLTEELIGDTDANRACTSQEEAFFRNYQWFFNERKHLLIMPQRLIVPIPTGGGLESGVIYIYQEANGYYGFANARTNKGGNKVWAKAGTNGRSTMPGDHRMGVVADFSNSALLIGQSADSVYDSTLGGGPGFSSVLAQNLASLARLAFPTVKSGTRVTCNDSNGGHYNFTVIDGLLPSNCFNVGDENWNKRNAVMPILMAMFNALRSNTDYHHSNTTGLVSFFDTMTILLKPLSYYQRDTGAVPNNTWKYRVFGTSGADGYFLKSGGDFYMSGGKFQKPDTWYGSDTERTYYQAANVPTLFSMLIDSDRYGSKKLMDGILPLLVAKINPNTPEPTDERPKVLTQVFKLLMNIGEDKFKDTNVNTDEPDSRKFDETWQSWGTRRKLLYGLEQTSLLSKNTQGTFTTINEGTLTEKLPKWMFTDGIDSDGDGIPDDMRLEEIFANVDQNILVGSNDYTTDIKPGTLGYQMGLAHLPHDWDKNPDKLKLFKKYLEMASELLKPQGGDYSVVENVINVLDKVFNQVSPTNDQVKGVVHTMGITATTYNKNTKTWNMATVPLTNGKISFADHVFDLNDPSRVDDQYRVAAQYQPITNTISLALDNGVSLSFDEGNGKTTVFNTANYIFDSSVWGNALLISGGLLEYVLDVVDTTNDPQHNFSEVFKELYLFLGEQLFLNFDSSLWADVAQLMAGQVQVLTRNSAPSSASNRTQSIGFQYNGPIK